jgi:hypothetical protein
MKSLRATFIPSGWRQTQARHAVAATDGAQAAPSGRREPAGRVYTSPKCRVCDVEKTTGVREHLRA